MPQTAKTPEGESRKEESATGDSRVAKPRRREAMRVLGVTLLWLLLLPLHAWALVAIVYSNFPTPAGRVMLAAAYFVAIGVILWKKRPMHLALLLTVPVYAVILCWWLTIAPRTDLDFPPETARVATATFDGDRVVIDNVRNFHYRSESDFDERWEKRTYDLSKLETVDISFTYWGVENVAHTMASFGFADGEHVAVSVEQRRERGRENGLVEGFFKQFGLVYIWGDERDLVLVRTNHRKGEEVYLYRMEVPAAKARELMETMLRRTNDLARKPEFYNTATDNCTSSILHHMDEVTGKNVPFWKRPMRTGFYEKRGYEKAFQANGLSFEELKAVSHINERAREAGDVEDFSRRIRTHFWGDSREAVPGGAAR